MQDDLASRISDGSIAVLELLPGDERFADLSNYVLRGGASRFAPVINHAEPIRYVLPVGIPGTSLNFGTLLLQRTRCAVVWKSDPLRPYRALVMELGPDTTVSQSAVHIRGEAWGRFDLRRAGSPDLTFLVPPVTSAALPQMLRRVLVDEPHSQARKLAVAPLGPEITEAPPKAQPVTPAPAPTDAPAAPAEAPAAPAVAPAASAEAPLNNRSASTSAPAGDPDATRPMQAVELDATRPLPVTPAAATTAKANNKPSGASAASRWTPRRSDAAQTQAEEPTYREQAVFRDTARQAPAAQGAAAPAAAVQAPVSPRPTATALVEEDDDTVEVSQVPIADTLKGFLTGFGVTVVLGGLVVLGRVIGLV